MFSNSSNGLSKNFVIHLLVLFISIKLCHSIYTYPQVHCMFSKPNKTICHHGEYRDHCNRWACYKGVGETCGERPFEELQFGRCAEFLSCSCGKCIGCRDGVCFSVLTNCKDMKINNDGGFAEADYLNI